MYSPTCKIKIGAFVFYYIVDVNIDSSWKNQTDTCIIKLARNIKLGGKRLADLVKVGDAVEVELGYDGNNTNEFSGYLTHIKSTTPIEFECEDSMYLLKKGSITKSWKDADLTSVLEYILPSDMPFKTIGSIHFGKFTVNKLTPAKVLEQIKKEYGIKSFFRNGVLIAGRMYDTNTLKVHKYHLQKNVVKCELEFKTAEEVKVKVKAISMLANGKKIEVEVGDSDGEERTLHYYDLQKSELEKIAKLDINRLKYDGYEGDITTFGVPVARHGDVAEIDGVSHQLSIGEQPVSDHKGQYYIDAVNTTFGVSGFKRKLSLGFLRDHAITSI